MSRKSLGRIRDRFSDTVKKVPYMREHLRITEHHEFSDTVKKVPYMRGQNNNFVKNLGKISYVGTQINNGVNAATQGLNIATGNVRDNWDTTSKWNKMIKGIDNVSDRENKTLDTYTIQTSTRYNNLNYIFN